MAQYVPTGKQIPGASDFFGMLQRAEVTDPTREAIAGALSVLLEDDEDEDSGYAPPRRESFSDLLTFLSWHHELPPPALAINPAGLFTASWHAFKVEFQLGGQVHWTAAAKLPGRTEVKDGSADLQRVPVPGWLRSLATA